MKEKILEEVMKWYESQGEHPDVFIEDFVDLVINKTTDDVFERVKDDLKKEFENGNLTHPFIISSDYYLDLKLKEIKQKCVNKTKKDNVSDK